MVSLQAEDCYTYKFSSQLKSDGNVGLDVILFSAFFYRYTFLHMP